MIDLDAIRRNNPLPAIVGGIVKLQRAGNEWKACCPFHSDKSPSFTIWKGGERFQCFGCGAQGDVLDFVQRHYGVDLPRAAAMLSGGDLPTTDIEPLATAPKQDSLDEARAIWRGAAPAQGTAAETYLRFRRLHLPIPPTIRFSRLRYGNKGREHPVLIAAVVGPDNRLCGIQRTYLADSGHGKAAVPKPKLSLSRVSGGAIRLAPAAAELIVCEGLEDGLTLQQELGQAVWVAAGASMLPAMRFPATVRSVVIGGDADDTGRAAAEQAAEAFATRGLKVRTFFPTPPFKDFNDEIRGRGQ